LQYGEIIKGFSLKPHGVAWHCGKDIRVTPMGLRGTQRVKERSQVK